MPTTQTLLIIDDCPEDREVYRRYLLQDPEQSYQILEADCAQEGLALYQQSQCDAILVDFRLPDMNGLELIEQIRSLSTDIPTILLTAYGDEEVAVQAIKQGVRDYLAKHHLKADKLQSAVRNAIEQSCLQNIVVQTYQQECFIAHTALNIRQSLELEQVLTNAVVEIKKLLQCQQVVIYQHLADNSQKIVAKSTDKSKTKTLGRRLTQSDCVAHNHPVDAATKIVPIVVTDCHSSSTKVWGSLVVQAQNPTWDMDNLEMLYSVTFQLAIAIGQAELLANTKAQLIKEKQLNAFKRKMSATIAHNYRSPLASILAAASTLKQQGEHLNPKKQQQFLELIEQKTRSVVKLVDDMLVVNQLELDEVQFKPLPLDLLQFFSELIEEQREVIGENCELIFSITGNHQGFWGDRVLLRQIFLNLLSNAVKFSPNRGKIEFHLNSKNSYITFSLQDSGIGIADREIESLSQSFFRGSNVDVIPGNGLGLAITKACVELHGGTMKIESQLGKGTKVVVSLPKKNLSKEEIKSYSSNF